MTLVHSPLSDPITRTFLPSGSVSCNGSSCAAVKVPSIARTPGSNGDGGRFGGGGGCEEG